MDAEDTTTNRELPAPTAIGMEMGDRRPDGDPNCPATAAAETLFCAGMVMSGNCCLRAYLLPTGLSSGLSSVVAEDTARALPLLLLNQRKRRGVSFDEASN